MTLYTLLKSLLCPCLSILFIISNLFCRGDMHIYTEYLLYGYWQNFGSFYNFSFYSLWSNRTKLKEFLSETLPGNTHLLHKLNWPCWFFSYIWYVRVKKFMFECLPYAKYHLQDFPTLSQLICTTNSGYRNTIPILQMIK